MEQLAYRWSDAPSRPNGSLMNQKERKGHSLVHSRLKLFDSFTHFVLEILSGAKSHFKILPQSAIPAHQELMEAVNRYLQVRLYHILCIDTKMGKNETCEEAGNIEKDRHVPNLFVSTCFFFT